MECKYWTNHLIIREMKIWERYPCHIAKVTGKMKTHYDSQRMKKNIVGEMGFPSQYQAGHSQCLVSKKEHFWKGQLGYDGDDDNEDNDDDSTESDDQLHLPRLQVTSSKSARAVPGPRNFPYQKSKFAISYNERKWYSYQDEHLQTRHENSEFNQGNSSKHHSYRNHRHGLGRQNALSSDNDDELTKQYTAKDIEHAFSKSPEASETNYTERKNRNRTKARKHKAILPAKNTRKTNEKYNYDCESDSDEQHEENHRVCFVSDYPESGETTAPQKGLLKTDKRSTMRSGIDRNHRSPLATRKQRISLKKVRKKFTFLLFYNTDK